ncbi:MAG: adenosylmethionine--8-amino-7-oxononanoate transaminase [Verrucomicrobiota bacterium]
MSELELDRLRRLDKAHFWHPFTQMLDWCESEEDPLIIESGEGALLRDQEGREYFDGNSSIWTNLHGHRHPTIDQSIREQLDRIAHCSALGFSNEPAIELAEKLVKLFPPSTLTRVFYSDDGSTAVECACKMSIQYRQLVGQGERTEFVAFGDAYHGDTMGAASLGGIGIFNERFDRHGYSVNRIDSMGELEAMDSEKASAINAVIFEPLIQGAAGMKVWPSGMLRRLREWCDHHGVFLILDEVMTGFGRSGKMFACEHENIVPDFICLAKGLTGGYLPLAATLTTEEVFEAFLGSYAEMKTFFYGHSYCGNPLGCAAALGSLRVFAEEGVIDGLPDKIATFEQSLQQQAEGIPEWGEIRQVGLMAGIDVVDGETGGPLDWRDESGAKICRLARREGLLTRPVRDTLTLMPPLCASTEQIDEAVASLARATRTFCQN